jgi:hypothetical protein
MILTAFSWYTGVVLCQTSFGEFPLFRKGEQLIDEDLSTQIGTGFYGYPGSARGPGLLESGERTGDE